MSFIAVNLPVFSDQSLVESKVKAVQSKGSKASVLRTYGVEDPVNQEGTGLWYDYNPFAEGEAAQGQAGGAS
ncbi:aspartic protein nepenthesin-1 [Dorcoceras hygrometricum]|uniref:Aspartic protein nepenthesin-1 n=1 Tax=Dorcoceras hygrometricum TaxID=472368 RepID=A0A2Z7AN19_9LAMI|nr:aspartic protein nepenthesin-1 [Dorcoceras hygrometricum]